MAVPKVGRKKLTEEEEEQVAALRKFNTRGKKSSAVILAEQAENRRDVAPVGLRRGRDNDVAKKTLADKFTYGGAYMTPGELARRREQREEAAEVLAG